MTENLRIDKDGDVILLTVGLYKFFLAHGKEGRIAKDVYEHLIFTARIQESGAVWAKDSYIKKGLDIGAAAIKKAKAFLKKHGLIEYVRRLPEKGNPRLGEVYIKVNLTTGSKTTPLVNNTTSKSQQIPKEKKKNAMREKEKGGRAPNPAEASPPRSARGQAEGHPLSLFPEHKNKSPESLEDKLDKIHRKRRKTPLNLDLLDPQTQERARELIKKAGEADFLAGFEAFLKSDEQGLKDAGYPFPWYIKQASQYIGKAKEGRIYDDVRIVPPEPLTDQERAEGEKILQELKEDFGSRTRGKNGRRCGESTEKAG